MRVKTLHLQPLRRPRYDSTAEFRFNGVSFFNNALKSTQSVKVNQSIYERRHLFRARSLVRKPGKDRIYPRFYFLCNTFTTWVHHNHFW